MSRFFKNKKAMEPSTLTWVVAMFIILFILVLFLSVTFLMAGSDALKGKLKNPFVVQKQESRLDDSIFLTGFLNSNLNGKTVSETIQEWVKNPRDEEYEKILSAEFDKQIDSAGFECYILAIETSGEINNRIGKFTRDIDSSKTLELLEQGVTIYFPYENSQKTTIRFYGGGCPIKL